MKVVIAIDSLKGSLSSMDAGNAIKQGILRVCDAQVIVKPLADGGEGTVDALLSGMEGRKVERIVTGPLGEKISASYGILFENNTGILEMAAAAGINLVPKDLLNPLNTTTYGVGEMISDAIQRGCRNFIIGIGGSATNDCGIGMLQALGFKFTDKDGNSVGIFGKDILEITGINEEGVLPELKECRFKIACDVTNPLFGEQGATHIFGPQKGATPDMVTMLDNGFIKFSELIKHTVSKDYASIPGAGAAGGLGYAFLTFLNATLESGIQIILNQIKLENDIHDADFVITGEGRLDFQTSMGKAPVGVARLAKKHGKKVIAFAGGTTMDAEKCNDVIDAYFSILQLPMPLNEAMNPQTTTENLSSTASQVFRLISTLDSSKNEK